MKRRLFVKLSFVALLLIICFECTGCVIFKKRVNLNDYFNYSYYGVDGYTDIETSLDREAVRTKYTQKVKEKRIDAFNEFVDSLEYTVDNGTNMNNGDVVTVTFSCDEEIAKKAGFKIVKPVTEITIEGLLVGTMIDLFEGVEVVVSGIAPFSTATVANNSGNSYVAKNTYTLSKDSGFRNQDVITVKSDRNLSDINADGYVALCTEKKFAVSGMDEYVSKSEDIDTVTLSGLVNAEIAALKSDAASSMDRMIYKVTGDENYLSEDNQESVTGCEVVDAKLLVIKDMNQVALDTSVPYNRLLIVIKGNVANKTNTALAYFCFEYNNVIMKGNGELFVKTDNLSKRYLCDIDYDALIAKVYETFNGDYTENVVDISTIVIE